MVPHVWVCHKQLSFNPLLPNVTKLESIAQISILN